MSTIGPVLMMCGVDELKTCHAMTLRQRLAVAAMSDEPHVDEIARQFGITRSAVYKRLSRAGFVRQRRPRRRVMTASQLGSAEFALDLDHI